MADISIEHPAAPYRLLVVDDEPGTRRLVEMIFQLEGFTVISAADGEEAMTMIHDCDVVLLDLMMPGMDGMEVLRQVRANADLAGLPILMFTARTDGFTATMAKAEGASAFHTKPLDLSRLVTDVRRLVEARSNEQQAAEDASPEPID